MKGAYLAGLEHGLALCSSHRRRLPRPQCASRSQVKILTRRQKGHVTPQIKRTDATARRHRAGDRSTQGPSTEHRGMLIDPTVRVDLSHTPTGIAFADNGRRENWPIRVRMALRASTMRRRTVPRAQTR
jgi:hypothetical protein